MCVMFVLLSTSRTSCAGLSVSLQQRPAGRECPHYKAPLVFLLPALCLSLDSTGQLQLYLHRMSGWEAYLKTLKAPDTNGFVAVDQAAIYGKEGAVWASDPGLANITLEEFKKLSGDSCCFYQESPMINGQKYMFLRDERKDDKSYCMFLKKKDHGSMCIGETKTALIIAHAFEGRNAGSIGPKVYNVVKYLREQGY